MFLQLNQLKAKTRSKISTSSSDGSKKNTIDKLNKLLTHLTHTIKNKVK